MLSRSCSDLPAPGRHLATGLVMALLLSACAGGPAPKPSNHASAGGHPQGMTELSPEAQTLFEQAAAVMATGDMLDAEFRFQEVLLQYPEIAAAHTNLAIIHVYNGNDAAARESVDAALALDPEFAPALNQLGMLLRKNGNFLDAEAAYLKAVTVSPEYALAHYNLGVLYELYLQRLDAALQHYELYQEIAGNDENVDKWITDLTRRVAANQRSASMTD